MGKELISVLLQPTKQKAHFWALALYFFVPFLSHKILQVRVLKTIWEIFWERAYERLGPCPAAHSLETDDRKIPEELFSPVKNTLKLRFV